MSKFTEFYAKAMEDTAVKKELQEILEKKSIEDATEAELIKIGVLAKRLGFEITLEEAQNFLHGEEAELDENDLDAVAGGSGKPEVGIEYPGIVPILGKGSEIEVHFDDLGITDTIKI